MKPTEGLMDLEALVDALQEANDHLSTIERALEVMNRSILEVLEVLRGIRSPDA